MNNIQIYNYGGTNDVITFKIEDGAIYINATEMAQSFNKLPAHYLSTETTKKYISAVSVAIGIPIAQLVSVTNGVGTWLHEDIAIDFAQWLNFQPSEYSNKIN